jgi:hypothetical protein
MVALPGPHSDDDTFDIIDIIDNALLELATRRGVWLGDELTMISLLVDLIDQAERCLTEPVTIARANGHSWTEIATLLATSPEQAQLRFDPESPITDNRWPYDTDQH